MCSTPRPTRSPALPRNTTLAATLDRLRGVVEGRLSELLPPPGDVSGVVAAAMRAAVTSPGKRLRPVFTLMVAESFGGNAAAALDVACVVELVHAASLILDDLPCMDDAMLRRGEPTIHRRFGEATAILAAFALLARAQGHLPAALAAAGVAPAHRAEMERRLSEAVETMCHGQARDLGLAGRKADLAALERIHAQKTGALFELAAELGCVTAGLRGARLELVLSFARNLGLAFQVGDDLLDACGRTATLGKDPGRDASLGRTTFVSVFGAEGAATIRDELLAAAHSSLSSLGDRAALLSEFAEHVRTRTA